MVGGIIVNCTVVGGAAFGGIAICCTVVKSPVVDVGSEGKNGYDWVLETIHYKE